MGKDLTDTERAIIQQVILDRWNPLRLNKKIASHFGLTINALHLPFVRSLGGSPNPLRSRALRRAPRRPNLTSYL